MGEKGKIEKMRDVTKAGRESERVGSDTVVSVYTKLITRTSNECRWLLVGKFPPLAISSAIQLPTFHKIMLWKITEHTKKSKGQQ